MKNCKKLLIVLLTVLMVAVSANGFAACGGGGNNNDTSSDVGGGASVHTHDWNERVTKEATCEEEGVVTYSCYCGESYTVDLSALGHKLKWHEAKAATCTEFGWEAYELCQRDGCGYTTYKQIDAKGHNFDKGYCTVEGCGVAQPPEDHIEHEWGEGVVTTKPTCTAKGVKTFTCWCTEKYTEPVAELGHDNEQHEGQAATCVAIGWKAYETCKRDGCDYTTYEEIAINENNHDLEFHEGQEATCIANGWKAYETCKCDGCNYTTYEEIAINENNHDYVDGICRYCNERYSIGLSYSISNDNSYYILVGIGRCKDERVVIPDTYEGLPVKQIGVKAFEECSTIKEIVIPNGVTSINLSAFANCGNLTEVVFPNTIQSISDRAFQRCTNLKDVILGSDLTYIGVQAFEFCSSLTEMTIPNHVTKICLSAFYGCDSLRSVFIGASVESIENGAFRGCDNLRNIAVDENNLKYCSVDGNLYNKAKTGLVQYAIGKTNTSFIIPNGVIYFGNCAFEGCINLTEVIIPDSVTRIDGSAFSGCYKLIEVYNKSNLNIVAGASDNGYVGYYAKNVYTEEGGSKLIIDENGFIIYDGNYLVSYIGDETEISIPAHITTIGDFAFYSCSSLTKIVIPNSMTSIKPGTFESCVSLTSVVIPNSVTTIGAKAFSNCTSLTSLVIPNSVTSVGDYAFSNCLSLTSVSITNR